MLFFLAASPQYTVSLFRWPTTLLRCFVSIVQESLAKKKKVDLVRKKWFLIPEATPAQVLSISLHPAPAADSLAFMQTGLVVESDRAFYNSRASSSGVGRISLSQERRPTDFDAPTLRKGRSESERCSVWSLSQSVWINSMISADFWRETWHDGYLWVQIFIHFPKEE